MQVTREYFAYYGEQWVGPPGTIAKIHQALSSSAPTVNPEELGATRVEGKGLRPPYLIVMENVG